MLLGLNEIDRVCFSHLFSEQDESAQRQSKTKFNNYCSRIRVKRAGKLEVF